MYNVAKNIIYIHRFSNNVIRDTLIVCFGNCLTSVVAGFAIFSVLGFLAKELGTDVEDVVESGAGLAFIAYPDLVFFTSFPLCYMSSNVKMFYIKGDADAHFASLVGPLLPYALHTRFVQII
jgi:hypothetical protein